MIGMKHMSLTTLVLGASPKEDRYSNKAVRKLVAHGHPVIAVGLRAGHINGTPIVTLQSPDLLLSPDVSGSGEVQVGQVVDTVTLYLNADNQRAWEERILALKPRRIIFNPGAENERLARSAAAIGIKPIQACTLVMLSTGQY